ncbi:MAG: hypothetical protein ABWX96_01060 [Propionibacteriaceae bacterium]
MTSRPVSPLLWLLASVVLLQVAAGAGSGTGTAVALVAAAMVVGYVGQLVVRRLPQLRQVELSSPASRRLHGRFLSSSRPGVPGRTRSRAPGCGH